MQNDEGDFFVAGQAISEKQGKSETWCKLHVDEVIRKFQNTMCPTHPPSKINPLKPPNCKAAIKCGCGGVATLRLVVRDFLNDKKKGSYSKSMAKCKKNINSKM